MTATDDAFKRVLDVDSWEFYVLPTSLIEQELRSAKSVSLSKLRSLRGPVDFRAIRLEVDSICG
jgi:hypothetical protein